MACLSDSDVSRLVGGTLEEAARAGLDAHLRECASCRERVGAAKPLGETTRELSSGEASALVATTAPLKRGSLLGRYVVLDVLGAGGMGEVYTAIDPELDRKVALKLVKDGAGSTGSASQGQTRLLREAQAMAKLSHPNVVSVYDVGVVDGRVFLAMELVEGVTVKQWMKEPRSWREVLRVFIDAGRGLAAAHRTGIVHRDFKPENILIAHDGRARVLDFGLARAATGATERDLRLEHLDLQNEATPNASKHLLLSALTQAEQVIGTPKYMAPEQFYGQAIDARTDQFAFCLALAEAMYGEAPFEGTTLETRARSVTAGQVRSAPRGTPVPQWLRRVVLRGLSVDPAGRFPGMDALLEALTADPAVPRRRALSVAAIVVAVIGAGALGASLVTKQQRVCQGAAARLTGAWDDARRTLVAAAFTATKQPFAGAAMQAVASVLDKWALEWTAAVTEACEATRLRGEQSEEALDLKMECLNQRLDEVRALSDLLTRADKKLVEAGPRAVSSVASLKACAEVSQLRDRQRLPADPEVRRRVNEVRKQLAQVRALTVSWRYKDAVEIARQAADLAKDLPSRPLIAESAYRLALIQDSMGDFDAAGAGYETAVRAAVAGRDDRIAATAWTKLFALRGESQAKFDDGEWLALQAEAAVERMGDDADLRGLYFNHLGSLRYTEGKYELAADSFRKSVEAYERSQPESLELAASMSNLGAPLAALGRNDEALKHYERAYEIQKKILGEANPVNQMVLGNIASSLLAQSRFEEAHHNNLAALALAEQSQGPEGDSVALILGNLAYTWVAIEKPEQGLEAAQRALKINTAKLGANHPSTGYSLLAVATVMLALQRTPESIDYHLRALAVAEKAYPEGHELTVYILCGLGELELAQGRGAPAQQWFQKCLAVGEKALGKDVPGLVRPLVGLAGAQQLQLQHAVAISTLERARGLTKPDQNSQEELGRLTLRLACAFKAEKRPAEESQKLAEEALEHFRAAAAMGKEGTRDAEEVVAGKPCPRLAASGGELK